MLKKLLSSRWMRTVLPLAILPLAAYLEAVRHCWGHWPWLSLWDALEVTTSQFTLIFSRGALPYTLAAIATGIILGIFWHRSRGERRFGYWLLLFLLSVTLYPAARSYGVTVKPPLPSMTPASTVAVTAFWCYWVLALLVLVVWDIRSRKKL